MTGTRWTDEMVAELMAALEPFAKEIETPARRRLCPGPDIDHWPIGANNLTFGHLRAARAALQRARGEG